MKKRLIEDLKNYSTIGQIKLSPEGSKTVFSVQTVNDSDDGYDSNLWLEEQGKLMQLTSHNQESSFIWDDENTILFPAVRDSKDRKRAEELEEFTSYYRLSINGGEALKAFSLPIKSVDIELIETGLYLVTGKCSAEQPDYYKMSEEDRKKVAEDKKKNTDFHIFDESPFWFNSVGVVNKQRSRLFLYEETSKTLTPISEPLCEVSSKCVIGKKIFFTGQVYKARKNVEFNVYRFDLDTKQTYCLYENHDYHNSNQGVAPLKDQLVFYAAPGDQYGMNEHANFYIMDQDSGERTLLREADYSFYASEKTQEGWTFNANLRTNNEIVKLSLDGSLQSLFEWPHSIRTYDADETKVVFGGLTDTQFSELYQVDLNTKEITQLTHFNQDILNDTYVGVPEHFVFQSDDREIDGWVIKPIDYDETKKYPGILTIHGGPKGSYDGTYSHDMQIWASEGYFVFYCNPFGSDGRGNAFAHVTGLHGTKDYEDCMNLTDEVLRRFPALESTRLGVTGVSYGGYMTNWIIGHTDRFAAASSQCSVVSWISTYGVSDISMNFVPDQMGVSLYDKNGIDVFWEHSPLKYACHAKTPTLFIQPTDDFRCPIGDGLQMFTALVDHGTEAKVCTFKGDHHGLNSFGKPSHRIRSFEETLNWMNRFCK